MNQTALGTTTIHFGDEIVAEWIDIAPINDDAAEYCLTRPLHIPLRDRLFTNVLCPITLPAANTKIVQLTQTRALDSVQWSRRGRKRAPQDIANKQSRGLIEAVGSDSDSSNSDCNYDYVPLNPSQKVKFKSFFKYIGKHFVDATENCERIEGRVHAILMESANKTVCFEYYENEHPDEPQYIVADFAINECQWMNTVETDDNSSSSGDDDTNYKKRGNCADKQKCNKKSARTIRGWYYLSDDESCVVASVKEPLHCSIDAPRQLRNNKRI